MHSIRLLSDDMEDLKSGGTDRKGIPLSQCEPLQATGPKATGQLCCLRGRGSLQTNVDVYVSNLVSVLDAFFILNKEE